MFPEGMTFWVFAWILMGAAFMSAFFAIIGGAKALDRESTDADEDNN